MGTILTEIKDLGTDEFYALLQDESHTREDYGEISHYNTVQIVRFDDKESLIEMIQKIESRNWKSDYKVVIIKPVLVTTEVKVHI